MHDWGFFLLKATLHLSIAEKTTSECKSNKKNPTEMALSPKCAFVLTPFVWCSQNTCAAVIYSTPLEWSVPCTS